MTVSAERFGRVAVLMGGWSAEREISLQSGKAVLEALLAEGVDAVGIDVDRNIAARLAEGGFSRAFNILHGRGGEDGVIQGLLEVLDLPYTGSGVKASAIAMDKVMSKRLWSAQGLPTPAFMPLDADTEWSAVVEALGLPLIVKPACEGSSIGMSIVESEADLPAARRRASEQPGEAFAEQWIDGEEYTVTIIGDAALPAIRLETPHAFYDYAAKYQSDDTRYLCPCGLSAAEEQRLGELSLAAFRALGARGWGRVDLMRDKQGAFWLIELNTIPGMTTHSLAPKAARAAGMSFEQLVMRILSTSDGRTANG